MQNQQPPNQPPAQYYPYYLQNNENEINLGDLWLILVEKKHIILATIILFLIFASAYLTVTPNVYQTTAITLPPSQSDIQALNSPGLQTFDTQTLYDEFLTRISSVTIQRQAFDLLLANNTGQSFTDEEKNQLFNSLAESIKITASKKNDDETRVSATKLQIDSSKPSQSEAFLNLVIDQAERATINANFTSLQMHIDSRLTAVPAEINLLTQNEKNKRENQIIKLEEEISTKKAALQQQITTLRNKLEIEKRSKITQLEESDNIAKRNLVLKIEALRTKAKGQRLAKISRLEQADQIERTILKDNIRVLRDNADNKRLDRIQILKEAANIAKSLDLSERAPLANIPTTSNSSSMVYTEIKTSATDAPLYLNGERALRAEIKELEARKSEDAFILELRPLLDQLALLESNEMIINLKTRTNDDPFIEELPELLKQLALLDNNAEIEALKARTNNDPYSPELMEYQRQLEILEKPAQLIALKNRISDTPYAEGIKELDNERRQLESVKLLPQLVKVAIIDREAYTSDIALKPKKVLIIALACVAGLMLGLFAAFFLHFIQSQAKRSLPVAINSPSE